MGTTLHPYLGVSKVEGYQKKKANKRNSTNQRRYGLHLHKKKDKRLIAWMEEHKPYQSTIKRLIREEMAREKQQAKK